jgi:hypothetical protein
VQSFKTIDKTGAVRNIDGIVAHRRRLLYWARPFIGLFLSAIAVLPAKAADDLKTKSGRTYKDAIILRADATGLVIQHRFGVVRIPFSEISAGSKRKFNAQTAREAAQQRRADEQRAAAERLHATVEEPRQEKSDLQRASVELEEQDQANAEGLEEKIQRGRTNGEREHRSSQRLRLRGEVIGLGPGWILVLCESGGDVVKRELARLPNSPFTPSLPALEEVVAVTGVRQSINEGESIDVVVQESGTKREFRTRSGDSYSGKYRVFRAVD